MLEDVRQRIVIRLLPLGIEFAGGLARGVHRRRAHVRGWISGKANPQILRAVRVMGDSSSDRRLGVGCKTAQVCLRGAWCGSYGPAHAHIIVAYQYVL